MRCIGQREQAQDKFLCQVQLQIMSTQDNNRKILFGENCLEVPVLFVECVLG